MGYSIVVFQMHLDVEEFYYRWVSDEQSKIYYCRARAHERTMLLLGLDPLPK